MDGTSSGNLGHAFQGFFMVGKVITLVLTMYLQLLFGSYFLAVMFVTKYANRFSQSNIYLECDSYLSKLSVKLTLYLGSTCEMEKNVQHFVLLYLFVLHIFLKRETSMLINYLIIVFIPHLTLFGTIIFLAYCDLFRNMCFLLTYSFHNFLYFFFSSHVLRIIRET